MDEQYYTKIVIATELNGKTTELFEPSDIGERHAKLEARLGLADRVIKHMLDISKRIWEGADIEYHCRRWLDCDMPDGLDRGHIQEVKEVWGDE